MNVFAALEGTEAAAATAVVGLVPASARAERPRQIRADRPFLFLIRDNASGQALWEASARDSDGNALAGDARLLQVRARVHVRGGGGVTSPPPVPRRRW